jgi:TolB-like protein/Flp pilus assembly protein TadD
MQSFFAELQRRHVYKVGAMYAVAGWLLVQVVTQVLPVFDVSPLAQRIIVLVIVAGFPVALVLSWLFDITPQGIVRTGGQAASVSADPAAAPPARRERLLNYVLGVMLLLAGAYMVAERIWLRPAANTGLAAAAASKSVADKSIAVLPFENLSDDKANAYFAEGIQDEILTKLARIGALRVISRSSTLQFAARPGNLAEVARQLGVAHVLEGSVQKIGDAVHINVQLIRAATDDHLWAETYDRKLDNVFGVEAEVAQAIAQALQAHISGGEAQTVAAKPTENAAAYDAYLRGLGAERQAMNGATSDGLTQSIAAYSEAVQLDPAFALAWARLSIIKSYGYFNLFNHTPKLLDEARQAADIASRLNPDMGEAYLAQGYYRYWGLRDFDGGLALFDQALQRLPNNADVLAAIAYIERRQGKWQESTNHLEQATRIDPLNISMLMGLATNYDSLRQFPQALAIYDRALASVPGNVNVIAAKAGVLKNAGDLDGAAALLAKLPDTNDNPGVFQAKLQYLIRRRQYDQAIAMIKGYRSKAADPRQDPVQMSNDFYLGFLLIWTGKPQEAQAPCKRALDSLNAMRATDADDATLGSPYAAVYVCLGDKAKALHAATQAVKLNANDALERANADSILAITQAWTGDLDAVFAALPRLLQETGGLDQSELQESPFWDPLRKDPRFAAFVASK